MNYALHFPLPYWVEFEGERYEINPYFDTVLKVLSLQKETALTDYEKIDLSCELLVNGKLPRGISKKTKLLNEVIKTLIESPKENDTSPQAFDFAQDSGSIYSSFLMDYGIDLYEQQGKLHWWKFIHLFKGLSDKTKIVQVMQIRQKPMPPPNKHNTEERATLARLKSLYALERSQHETEQDFANGLKKLASVMEGMARR